MNTVVYVLIWVIVLTIVLAFIPNEKIREIAKFFKVVMPKIPFTDIMKMFKK